MAHDDRMGIDFAHTFPLMLRHSKHSEPFFSNLLGLKRREALGTTGTHGTFGTDFVQRFERSGAVERLERFERLASVERLEHFE